MTKALFMKQSPAVFPHTSVRTGHMNYATRSIAAAVFCRRGRMEACAVSHPHSMKAGVTPKATPKLLLGLRKFFV